METPIVTPFYLDKGLWIALLTPVLLFISSRLGLHLDAAEIVGMVLPVVAYVVAHKWKTTVLTKQAMLSAASDAGKAADPAAVLNQ